MALKIDLILPIKPRDSETQKMKNITRFISSSTQKIPFTKMTISSSEQIMGLEHHYGAHNYHPLPVVFSKALGIHVWDPEGRR